MSYFSAVILGLAQGFAEFLPISSSGHLALLEHFFKIEPDNVLAFAVLLHLGTLFSVVAIYYKDIWNMIREFFRMIGDIVRGKGLGIKDNIDRRIMVMIIVATIPTGVIGVLFNDFFSSLYFSFFAIGGGLIFTGTILFVSERFGKNKNGALELKAGHAVLVGICQGIAIWPGISRSGSTLFGGLISGLRREFAVKYAFLISLPSILGSVVLEAPAAFDGDMNPADFGPIIIGVLIAAISGFIAIKTMIRIVSKQKLIYFSVYTWTLGIVVLAYNFFIL